MLILFFFFFFLAVFCFFFFFLLLPSSYFFILFFIILFSPVLFLLLCIFFSFFFFFFFFFFLFFWGGGRGDGCRAVGEGGAVRECLFLVTCIVGIKCFGGQLFRRGAKQICCCFHWTSKQVSSSCHYHPVSGQASL